MKQLSAIEKLERMSLSSELVWLAFSSLALSAWRSPAVRR